MQSFAVKMCQTITLALVSASLLMSSAPVSAHSSRGNPPDGPARGVPRIPPNPGNFVNFETPHVYPIDLSPNSAKLAAVNTADGRLELFDVDGGTGLLTYDQTVSVGYDPVSVRFRTNSEAWVVNHLSDSVSVVDIDTGTVVATIFTDDEPADVVFFTDSGNSAPLAAVSCSRPDKIQIFNASTHALVDEIALLGQDPRALATDGTTVYAAIFQSGNSTTILPNNSISNALQDGAGPYGGTVNPPFNNGVPGTAWVTPAGSFTSGTLPAGPPPQVSLIVRKDGAGVWRDDNGANWDLIVTGANAGSSNRPVGWDMTDNDIAGLTTTNGTAALTGSFGTNGYVTRRMNNCMALGINPSNGSLMLVGLEATNEIRFEPNLTGTFTRVRAAIANGTTGAEIALVDVNEEHLDAAQGGVGLAYSDSSVPQNIRDQSLGDPRGVAFNPAGTRAYVSGMGSGNIIVLDPATGARLGGVGYTIDLGSPTPGPTGLAHHGTLNRLYVMNKFAANIMVLNTTTVGTESILQTADFFDPTPAFINQGRDDFYDTHQNSGLGQIACASCHIDGRNDQLAWDLGDPAGAMKNTNQIVDADNPAPGEHNLMFVDVTPGLLAQHDDFHPMKGPMTTQTLQDIIGHEPHHWRGDRDGIEEFANAFQGLQGDDFPLGGTAMQQFENFLSSLHFPPNPFRPIDNSLPGGPKFVGAGNNPLLSLTGFYSPGSSGQNTGYSAAGTQLPSGDAWRGFHLYVSGNPLHTGAHPKAPESLDNVFQCVTCHSLPTGAGSIDESRLVGFSFQFLDIAPGPNGERHQGIFSSDGTGNTDGVTGSVNQGSFKVPHLRNQLDKSGFESKPDPLNGGLPHISTHGFGVLHDGGVDGLDTFLGSTAFDGDNDQDLSDIIAFTLCVNGDDFDRLAALPGAPTFFSPSGLPINMTTVGQLGPDGSETLTAHAGVGQQITINTSTPSQPELDRINEFYDIALSGEVELIAKGVVNGQKRGWVLETDSPGFPQNSFQFDDNAMGDVPLSLLLSTAGPGSELTFMLVPTGSGRRMGIDRDSDGSFDYREVLNGTDPNDPLSLNLVAPAAGTTGHIATIAALAMMAAMALAGRTLLRRRTEA